MVVALFILAVISTCGNWFTKIAADDSYAVRISLLVFGYYVELTGVMVVQLFSTSVIT